MDHGERPAEGARRGRKRRYTNAQIVEALKLNRGLKYLSAEYLGCSFNTLQRYIDRCDEARDVVTAWRGLRKDRAEFRLDDAINRGEAWAIMFALKNARDREYSDRLEVTGDAASPLEVRVNPDYGASLIPIAPGSIRGGGKVEDGPHSDNGNGASLGEDGHGG